MAQRRMLSRRVSFSKKMTLISLQDEVVWARGLPQTDDKGFLPTTDPEELTGLLFPLGKKGRRFAVAAMEESLKNLIDVELLVWCSCPLKKCLMYTNFELFQTLQQDRKPQLHGKDSIGKQCNPDLCIPMESNGIQLAPTPYTSTSPNKEDKRQQKEENNSLELIYQAMPKKVGKKAALAALTSTLKRCKDATPDDLLKAARNYAALVKREKRESQFIMHPATFFGPKEHWRDYLDTTPDEDTCGTCASGPKDGKPGYCLVAMKTKDPGDKPCKKYEREVAK